MTWNTSAHDEDWGEIAPREGYDDVWAAANDERWDRYSDNRSDATTTVELSERPKADFHWDQDACNYHRNSSGHWVVIGPVELVTMGTVIVRIKAGKYKSEEVLGLGEPFDHQGEQYRYGYIAQRSSKMHVRTKARGSYRSQEDAAKSYARQYGR